MLLRITAIILLVVSFFCILYPTDILCLFFYDQNIQQAGQSLRIASGIYLLFFLALYPVHLHMKNKKKKIFSIKNRDKLSFSRDSKTTFPSFNLLIFFCAVLTGTVLFATHLYNDISLAPHPDIQAQQEQVPVEK